MSCIRCLRPDNGSPFCARCEAEAEHEQNLDDDLETGRPVAPGACFLARFSDRPCEGRLVKVHLIPRSLLKREFPYGAYIADGVADRIPQKHRRHLAPNAKATLGDAVEIRSLDEIINDSRCWVWACGGAMGPGGHHGLLDQSRSLRIPRYALPAGLEEFAEVFDLGWWLSREYGPLEEGCPQCGDRSASAPAEVYCIECATGEAA